MGTLDGSYRTGPHMARCHPAGRWVVREQTSMIDLTSGMSKCVGHSVDDPSRDILPDAISFGETTAGMVRGTPRPAVVER